MIRLLFEEKAKKIVMFYGAMSLLLFFFVGCSASSALEEETLRCRPTSYDTINGGYPVIGLSCIKEGDFQLWKAKQTSKREI